MYTGNIILLGSPGSGKGTLSDLLREKYGYHTITTGDILRKEKISGSEIGNKIKDIIGKGNLVPDELISQIVEGEIKVISKRFILDGFPRTIPQGEFLESITKIGLVIYIEASDDVIKSRILERGKLSGREDDQKAEIIDHRISQFKKETLPLIDFYKKKGRIVYVDGDLSISQVFNQVNNILKIWHEL